MAIKTRAELLAAFADNTTGNITPEDLRDFVDSIIGVYGGLHVEGGTTAQAVVAATPEKLTEWLTNGVASGVTPDFTSDEITIDNDGVYQVEFTVSISGIAGATFELHLRKNGIDTAHGCEMKTANNDVQCTSFSNQLAFVDTDAVSVWIESDITGSFTVTHADLNVTRIG